MEEPSVAAVRILALLRLLGGGVAVTREHIFVHPRLPPFYPAGAGSDHDRPGSRRAGPIPCPACATRERVDNDVSNLRKGRTMKSSATGARSGLEGTRTGLLYVVSDLDRVAIDCEERFARAEATHKRGTAGYWRAALDPEQLGLDLPLPGAQERLTRCSRLAAGLCYLTSRPTACQGKTVAFLAQHAYPCPRETICRPPRKGLTTARFKVRVVRALSYGLSVAMINRHFRLATNRGTLLLLALWSRVRRTRKNVLFIDDSEKNRLAIAALGRLVAYTAASLDEAVEWLDAEYARGEGD